MFQLYRPVDGVPVGARRFIGVWISDAGSKSGRQYGAIISQVTETGRALGFRTRGPPHPRGFQNPASQYPFVGQIDGGKLVIKGTITSNVIVLTEQNRMVVTETWIANGIEIEFLLKPVWQLVEAERYVKR